MMNRMMMFVAVAELALAAQAVTSVTVTSGNSITIGDGIANSGDYELVAEAGSTIVLPAQEGVNCWVFTRVYLTGSGTVTLVAPDAAFDAPTVVFADGLATESDNVSLHVDVACVTGLKVGRSQDSPTAINLPVADIANVTFANANGVFGLREWATARKLPAVFETSTLVGVALYGTNPLRLGNTFQLANFDVVALSRDCIPDGCTVTVPPGRTFAFKPCGLFRDQAGTAAYSWYWGGQQNWSGQHSIVLGGKGARVLCRNNQAFRLAANISGLGEIVFQPDTDENINNYYRGMTYKAGKTHPVAVPVCSATEPEPTANWQGKVANWFDASDTDSFILLDYTPVPSGMSNSYTNGYPLLAGWKDKLTGTSGTYLFNRRFLALSDPSSDYVVQVLPYVVTGGLNGKDYVSMGSQGGKVSKPYGLGTNVTEARRLQFHSASTSVTGHGKPTGGAYEDKTYPYCIMVFGSQEGGGKAILNDKKETGKGDLARSPTTIAGVWTYYSGFSMVVNGMDAKPKSDKPNGGWQIVSLDMTATNTVLIGISGHQGGNFGGMNYAEVIFFSEKPTPTERMACELYLAKKWGLETAYTPWDTGYTELSGNGTLTLDDANLPGHDDASEVTVAGNFAGTINVSAGKTLVVSDRPAPLAPYDIPQQANITAWFDPSLDGAIDFNEHPDAPTGIARLYSRTASEVDKADGAYWMSMNAVATTEAPTGIGNKSGRYPFLVNVSYMGGFGIGVPINWMDFSKNASGETVSNNLRSHKLPVKDSHITNANTDSMPVRSVFMALETSLGGGNPIADTVGMNGMFRPRNGTTITSPIWSSANTVTMTHTWLDTNEVNGATAGYNGHAEVLGFEMSELKTMPVFLGYYNQGGNKNYEHIGETLIYSTTLTDAERLTVQEYLMAKWTGDMNSKYSDLSRATVTGAGNVYSPSLRNLPAFDSGFTGALAGGSNMTFTVDWSWNASAAVNAITIDRALTLDAGQVMVTLKGEAKAGTYALLTVPSGALAGKTFTLTLVNETGKAVSAKLVTSDTTLSLEILSQGTVLYVR